MSALLDLIRDLEDVDPIIKIQAAEKLQRLSSGDLSGLLPFKAKLMQLAGKANQQEVRWHMAQLLPSLQLSAGEREDLKQLFISYLDDESYIVQISALKALADMALEDESIKPDVTQVLEENLASGVPAIQARCKRLLFQLREESSY